MRLAGPQKLRPFFNSLRALCPSRPHWKVLKTYLRHCCLSRHGSMTFSHSGQHFSNYTTIVNYEVIQLCQLCGNMTYTTKVNYAVILPNQKFIIESSMIIVDLVDHDRFNKNEGMVGKQTNIDRDYRRL